MSAARLDSLGLLLGECALVACLAVSTVSRLRA